MRDFDELPQDIKDELNKFDTATNGVVKPNSGNILRNHTECAKNIIRVKFLSEKGYDR